MQAVLWPMKQTPYALALQKRHLTTLISRSYLRSSFSGFGCAIAVLPSAEASSGDTLWSPLMETHYAHSHVPPLEQSFPEATLSIAYFPSTAFGTAAHLNGSARSDSDPCLRCRFLLEVMSAELWRPGFSLSAYQAIGRLRPAMGDRSGYRSSSATFTRPNGSLSPHFSRISAMN